MISVRSHPYISCENQTWQASTFSPNHFRESSGQSLYALNLYPLFESQAERTGTLPHKTISESQAGNPRALSMQILSRKLSRTNRYTSTQHHFRESSRQSPYSLRSL